MPKIKTLKLTSRQHQNIINSAIINYGGESIICKSKNPNTLYKFFTYDSNLDPEIAYPNKKAKIQMLHDIPNLTYSVRPVSTIEVDGKFLGYEMTTNPDDITLADIILSEDEKIAYLFQIKKILDYYKSLGIIYGDVRGDNILINPYQRTTTFCDMDNIQIGNYSFDVTVDVLSSYIEEKNAIDETIDSFMFNLLILEQLAYPNETYNEIITRINNGIFPPNINKEANKILESMLSPKTYDGQTILQYIKK